MSQPIYGKILSDFFDGKATAIQRKYLEGWLREPGSEAMFFKRLDEWERQHPQYVPDPDEALARLLSLTSAEASELSPSEQPLIAYSRPRIARRGWIWSVAAALVLLVTVGFLLKKQILYQCHQTGNAQTRSFYLPDSTLVSLNANSKLWVPRWGFSDRRQVLLEGEGEFNVTHTHDDKRFTVRTDRAFDVEVLGTEFVVFSRPRGNRVVLNKGKVEVHFQQKQLTLHPGDMLTLPGEDDQPRLTKIARPELQTTWKNHQFFFDNAPLSEVRLTLEEHFGLEVTIADTTLDKRRLSGYFKATNAQEIAEILSAVLGVPVHLVGNQLTISN